MLRPVLAIPESLNDPSPIYVNAYEQWQYDNAHFYDEVLYTASQEIVASGGEGEEGGERNAPPSLPPRNRVTAWVADASLRQQEEDEVVMFRVGSIPTLLSYFHFDDTPTSSNMEVGADAGVLFRQIATAAAATRLRQLDADYEPVRPLPVIPVQEYENLSAGEVERRRQEGEDEGRRQLRLEVAELRASAAAQRLRAEELESALGEESVYVEMDNLLASPPRTITPDFRPRRRSVLLPHRLESFRRSERCGCCRPVVIGDLQCMFLTCFGVCLLLIAVFVLLVWRETMHAQHLEALLDRLGL
jgi:hypothetical protein